jgi:hypothetical protein
MKKKDFEEVLALKEQIQVVEIFLESLNKTLAIGSIDNIELKITEITGEALDLTISEQYLIDDIHRVLLARQKEVEEELIDLKNKLKNLFKENKNEIKLRKNKRVGQMKSI